MGADRRSQYIALAVMYFAQGLPAGLAFDALATLIRHGGHSVAAVGLTGLAFLPWAFKFLWAGSIDNLCRHHGFARVVLITQLVAAALCLALAAFSPADSLGLSLVGIVILNTVCATQDIATNAYAVTFLQGRRAGAANAIQVAGFIFGMMAGGGGLLIVHAKLGWAGAMVAMAAVMLVLYLPLRFSNWCHGPASPKQTPQQVRLRDLLKHRDLPWALLVALSFKFASTAGATLVKPWLVDHGLNLAEVGQLQIVNSLLGTLGGALLGIPLIRWLGNRRAVLVAASLSTIVLGTAWLLEYTEVRELTWLYAGFGLQAMFEGATYVAIWAMFMNWASRERPGTDYSAMQCSETVMNACAAGAIGGLGQSLGYAATFAWVWVAGAMTWVILAASLRRLRLAGEQHDPDRAA